jgi:hypothetical protein
VEEIMASKQEFTLEQKAFREGLELTHDSMKHLTTLSTGSFVIVTTFLEKPFTNPALGTLLSISVVFLFLSIVFSTVTMLAMSRIMMGVDIDRKEFDQSRMYYYIALSPFFAGFTLLGLFAYFNLIR